MLDHIDLRVPDLEAARPFYSKLLPAVGFSHEGQIPGWIQFYGGNGKSVAPFFGMTEDPAHHPNQNRIAFWTDSIQKVDELAVLIRSLGAKNIEGPGYEEETFIYYAVFFEDPWGNRLEICHRTANF